MNKKIRLVCESAGVNRSTFYAHYTDIYDMIEQMEANLQRELINDYPTTRSVVPLSIESAWVEHDVRAENLPIGRCHRRSCNGRTTS